uniref:Uncharacterized protein n=1 Tax=Arundo donax TaxID=35708 RepID=A0A0A9CYZ8_ARUDO
MQRKPWLIQQAFHLLHMGNTHQKPYSRPILSGSQYNYQLQ